MKFLILFVVAVVNGLSSNFCSKDGSLCVVVIRGSVATVEVKSKALGWVGIGVGSTTMDGADMYIAWLNSSKKVVVSRRTANGQIQPESAATSDAIVASSSSLEAFSFSLPNEKFAEKTSFIYAFSDSSPRNIDDLNSNFPQHSSSKKGSVQSEFSESGGSFVSLSDNSSTLRFLHGLSMFIAWGFCPIVGIFIARYLKDSLGHLWYILHVSFMLGGTTLFTAIGMILIKLQKPSPDFDKGTHGKIGITVAFAALPLQILLGFIANYMWSATRPNIPWWDKLHWFVGRITFVLAIVNIQIGFYLFEASTAIVVIFWVWIAVAFLAFLGYEYFKGGPVHHVNGTSVQSGLFKKSTGEEHEMRRPSANELLQ